MNICPSCGGIIGRDCFNPVECAWITEQQNREHDRDHRQEGYNKGYYDGYEQARIDFMLNTEQNDAVSDTTDDQQSGEAGKQNPQPHE